MMAGVAFCPVFPSLVSELSRLSSISSDSLLSTMMVDCFKLDPFGRRAEARRDVVESLEANDSDDALADREDVMYGLPLLDVLLGSGSGDIGRLLD